MRFDVSQRLIKAAACELNRERHNTYLLEEARTVFTDNPAKRVELMLAYADTLVMLLMQFGEVIFGGVGTGLYGMLMFAILAVFIAGLK